MSQRTISILAVVLAVPLLALAVFTIVTTSDLSGKVSDLEDQTAGLQSTTANLEAATSTGGASVEKEIEDLKLSLKKLRACLPEVQNEISGLGVELTGNYREGIYGFIENNSQVSSYCSPIVYGETNGVG